MPWRKVKPVIDPDVRRLCVRPYQGHRHGCPNYAKKVGCPPGASLLFEILDMKRDIYVIWNAFEFGAHVERMRQKHPEWSERQRACCLYWQGTARKALRAETASLRQAIKLTRRVIMCPEAMGVNVTETMRLVGIELEWPPRTIAYQVALLGTPKLRVVH